MLILYKICFIAYYLYFILFFFTKSLKRLSLGTASEQKNIFERKRKTLIWKDILWQKIREKSKSCKSEKLMYIYQIDQSSTFK